MPQRKRTKCLIDSCWSIPKRGSILIGQTVRELRRLEAAFSTLAITPPVPLAGAWMIDSRVQLTGKVALSWCWTFKFFRLETIQPFVE